MARCSTARNSLLDQFARIMPKAECEFVDSNRWLNSCTITVRSDAAGVRSSFVAAFFTRS